MDARRGENFRLHSEFLNPQLAKVLKTVGMDRFYERGEGCYLYDRAGDQLSRLSLGFRRVRARPRRTRSSRRRWRTPSSSTCPNLVQLDCALASRPPCRGARRAGCTPGMQRGASSPIPGPRRSNAPSSSPSTPPRRPRILHADHSFHGLTNGALSLNGGAEFRARVRPAAPRLRLGAVRRPRAARA